ncbi:hypothetical protein ACWGJ9_11215 [Curtobacterium citreum]
MDSTDPRRLAWLRAQAQSLGAPPKPATDARKVWLRQRALDAGYTPSPERQAALRRDLTGIGVLTGVFIVGIIVGIIVGLVAS